jgi:hypothetical protein
LSIPDLASSSAERSDENNRDLPLQRGEGHLADLHSLIWRGSADANPVDDDITDR